MKAQLLILILFGISLVGCGSDDYHSDLCSRSKFKGTWKSAGGNDTLTLDSDCNGSSSYCDSHFSYESLGMANMTNPGWIWAITIDSSNHNPGCPSIGTIVCDVNDVASNPNMQLDCHGGAGTVVYSKVPS
jgi:hypothetical protein